MTGEFDPAKLFDLSRMTDDELGHLEFVVNSPSWLRFMAYLKSLVHSIEKLMKDRSDARKAAYNDDFLAGQCTALEGFIAYCEGIVNGTNVARMGEVQRMTPDEEYQKLRTLGFIKGAGQHTRAEELIPFEEF